LTHSAPGVIRVDLLLSTHRYELLLHAQAQQLQRQRQVIGAEIERRRQTLVEADQELRILEKLRERHQAAFEFDAQKVDIRLLDEMALRRRRSATEIDVL
jgi:flagellar export protein FliJ